MMSGEIKEYPNGFVREDDSDRARFHSISLMEWEEIGDAGIPIYDNAEQDDTRCSITPYHFFVEGLAVDPYLDEEFIAEMELVLHKGAKKYYRDNWRKGCPRWRSFNAIIRHAIQAFKGCKKENHAAAIAINAMFLWHGDGKGE